MKALSPEEKELYGRVDEILHYLWDPIRVAGIPQARGEYHAYVPQVFRLVLKNRPAEEIAEYLLGIEQNEIGLSPDPKRALRVAEILLETRRAIVEEGL